MKKILFIGLILIGIISIGSNFLVDTSKLDHEVVNASGTACKWISESGYGAGPYYVKPNATAHHHTHTWSTGDIDYVTVRGDYGLMSILPCNSSNEGSQKDGNKIYDESGNLYSSPAIEKGGISSGEVVLFYGSPFSNATDDYYLLYSKEGKGGLIRLEKWTNPTIGLATTYDKYNESGIQINLEGHMAYAEKKFPNDFKITIK